MSQMRFRRYGQPSELEEGLSYDVNNISSNNNNVPEGGAVLSKLAALQARNIELENTIVSLRSQLDVMKSKLKSHGDTDDHDYTVILPQSNQDFLKVIYERMNILLILLIVQSFSSIILVKYETLLHNHPVIIQFLTMLIGAGGNAGNQAAVRVIRGMALGLINVKTRNMYLLGELKVGIALALIVGVVGFIRVNITSEMFFREAIAITVALILIVLTSVLAGSALPFIMEFFKLDPAHSSTSIQVIMDIAGVLLTCSVASLLM